MSTRKPVSQPPGNHDARNRVSGIILAMRAKCQQENRFLNHQVIMMPETEFLG
ncbi:MAG: hypothetical protein F6K47_41935 [Symploca sp. SIO2E6]|nr:hypothetical protein [Symploca sp. SIO2E6]